MVRVFAKKKTEFPQIPQNYSIKEGGTTWFTLLANILQFSQKEITISVVVSL